MSRDIYFKDLPELTQQRILDSYGAENAAELGLEDKPYATILLDDDGVGGFGIAGLMLKTANAVCI